MLKVAVALALGLGAGCGGAAAGNDLGAPARSGGAAAFPSAAVGPVESVRHQMELTLPDPEGWHLRRERSSFLVLEHGRTASLLLARGWRENEPVDRRRCEARARELRELPRPVRVIEQRRLDVPPGYDTEVVVGLAAAKGSDAVAGVALAFGARARRCFAWVYTTEARGPAAERVVGERLALMSGRALESVRLRSDLEPALK